MNQRTTASSKSRSVTATGGTPLSRGLLEAVVCVPGQVYDPRFYSGFEIEEGQVWLAPGWGRCLVISVTAGRAHFLYEDGSVRQTRSRVWSYCGYWSEWQDAVKDYLL